MARPWRIQYEGAIYHVMSRGVDRGKIFLIDEDYQRFLEYLERISEKFRVDIFAFVLMGNHYHLFLRTKEANLSKIMQWLQTSYSIYHNHKHNRCGHLFQGRFKSILVGNESYWQSLSLYIHLNPIRAEIVKKLEKYKWSSYHDYVGIEKVHRWVLCEEILSEFGMDRKVSRINYMNSIREVSGKEKKFMEDMRYGLILGGDGFVDWVKKSFIKRESKRDEELPQKSKVSDSGIIEKVLERVSKEFEVEIKQLLKRKRRIPMIARDVVMYILKMYTGLDNKKIGGVFSVSLSAVTKATSRVDNQMRIQKELKKKMDSIVYSIFKV
jgi:putative transposase